MLEDPYDKLGSTFLKDPLSGKTTNGDFVKWAMGLCGCCHVTEGELSCQIYATTFYGHYGPAGVVLTIEGSPVRATLLINGQTRYMVAIINHHRSKFFADHTKEYHIGAAWAKVFARSPFAS